MGAGGGLTTRRLLVRQAKPVLVVKRADTGSAFAREGQWADGNPGDLPDKPR